jgi:dTDP-4-dehydrorhamnose 3,5-epimerase
MNIAAMAGLPEVLLITPKRFGDERGYLFEAYDQVRYEEAGVTAAFVQDNVSVSRHGVLRGLHLQHPHDQAKLVMALAGEIWDVAVDVRRGSPTFGRWVAATLSAANGCQLYVPAGFAHGFCVLSETATVYYKMSDRYAPAAALSLAWNDPALAITWPVAAPTLSAQDAAAPRLAAVPPDRLPPFTGQGG